MKSKDFEELRLRGMIKMYSIAYRKKRWIVKEYGKTRLRRIFKTKEQAIAWAEKNLENVKLFIHQEDMRVERVIEVK